MDTNSRTMSRPSRALAALALSMAAATGAWAQAHTQDFGRYTLQSSTVNSMTLSEQTAQEHGITRDPRTAVLNVTVLQGKEQGVSRTIPARVRAQIVDMAGVINDIRMVETRAQGRVSYTGVYNFLPRQIYDVTITALPEGSQEPLKMAYRERMWANVNAN